MRSRAGCALRIGPQALALHPVNCAPCRLAMANSTATPHWQWPCVLQPVHQRRRGCRHTFVQFGWQAFGRSALDQVQHGHAQKAWNKNVIAIGLSSGFLEPLESTSIHLIQAAVAQLIEFFPDQGFSQLDIDTYNAQSRFQFERIRDFIILHYHVNQRTDSEFWKACAHMQVPDSLREKLPCIKRMVAFSDSTKSCSRK